MATAIEHPNSVLSSVLEQNTDKLLTCVHCGLCLPACPTYRVLGNENDSPRGRIYLMRGVVEGRLGLTEAFISHIDLCLGCRACESVCPSSVPYGDLLEAARVEVSREKANRGSPGERFRRFILNQVFVRPWALRFGMTIARWLRDSGLSQLAFESGLVEGRLRIAIALLLSTRSQLSKDTRRARKRPGEKPRFGGTRVSVLEGCVMRGLFGQVNAATRRVLARNGMEVIEAGGQGCCGALHAHAGQLETAKQLAKRNIEAFLSSRSNFVVVNAAGCGAAMKQYGELLAADAEFAGKAREFSQAVKDISELLMELGIAPPESSINLRVAYDAPCHLVHAQRISRAPIDLLEKIPGITIVPLRNSDGCCGGAGIYNLQAPEVSANILRDKLQAIAESGAETVATGNPGCIMQIGAGVLESDLTVDVVHPIELLDAAYSLSSQGHEP